MHVAKLSIIISASSTASDYNQIINKRLAQLIYTIFSYKIFVDQKILLFMKFLHYKNLALYGNSYSYIHPYGKPPKRMIVNKIICILICSVATYIDNKNMAVNYVCNKVAPQIKRICSATNLIFPSSSQDIIMILPWAVLKLLLNALYIYNQVLKILIVDTNFCKRNIISKTHDQKTQATAYNLCI